jgi:hypothetical protein
MTPHDGADDCCEVCRPDPCAEECLPDCNPCAGFDPCDRLTLVQYSILFTKRGLEVVFAEHEELVEGFVGPEQFATWKIAEFVSRLRCTPRPPKWRAVHYPPPPPGEKYKDGCPEPNPECKHVQCPINYIPPGDEKFLRVYCSVKAVYPRQRLHYAEDQLALLAEIRDAIAGKN